MSPGLQNPRLVSLPLDHPSNEDWKIHVGCIIALYTASEQLPLEYCAPYKALHYQEDIDWHIGGSSEKSNKNN